WSRCYKVRRAKARRKMVGTPRCGVRGAWSALAACDCRRR
ncbi:MAG: hypothetical protein AVDCRST_MAG42-2587, partial [uncultured Chthoniobacterales bacterium]